MTIYLEGTASSPASTLETEVIRHKSSKPIELFQKGVFAMSVSQMFALVVTFGYAFPPLAVIGLMSIFSYSYFTQVAMLYFIKRTVNGDSTQAAALDGQGSFIDMLSSNIQRSQELLIACLWFICPMFCLFFSLFVFDIMADDIGASSSLWAPLLLLVIPLIVYACKKLLVIRSHPRRESIQKDIHKDIPKELEETPGLWRISTI
jgi:hypothetical protein